MDDGILSERPLSSTSPDRTESTATITNSIIVLNDSMIRNNLDPRSDLIAYSSPDTRVRPVDRNDSNLCKGPAAVETDTNLARADFARVNLEASSRNISHSIPQRDSDNISSISSEIATISRPIASSATTTMPQGEGRFFQCTAVDCGKAFEKEAALSVHMDLFHPASPEVCDQKLIALLEAFGCDRLKTARDYDHLIQIYNLWLLSTGQLIPNAATNSVVFANFRNRVRDIQKGFKEAKKNDALGVPAQVFFQHQFLTLPTYRERKGDDLMEVDEPLSEAPVLPKRSASLSRLNYQDNSTYISRNSLGPGYVNKETQVDHFDPLFSGARSRSQTRGPARAFEAEPADCDANSSAYLPESHAASPFSPELPPPHLPHSSSRFSTRNESRPAYIPSQEYPEPRPTSRNPGMQSHNGESNKRKRHENDMSRSIKPKKGEADQDNIDPIEWSVMVKQYKNHFNELSDEKQRGVDQVAQAFRKTIWEVYWIFGLDVVFSRKCLTKLIYIGKERPDITVYDVLQKAQEKRKLRVINEGNRSRSIFTLADITKTHQFFCPNAEPDLSFQVQTKEDRLDSEEPENFRNGPRRSFHERSTGYEPSFNSRSEVNPARRPISRRGPENREEGALRFDDYLVRDENLEHSQSSESALRKKKRSQADDGDQFSEKAPQAADDHYSHHRRSSSDKSEHDGLFVAPYRSTSNHSKRTSNTIKPQYREVSEEEEAEIKIESPTFSFHRGSEEVGVRTRFDITLPHQPTAARAAPAAPASRASSIINEQRLPFDDPVSSLRPKSFNEPQPQSQAINDTSDGHNTPQERPYRYLIRKTRVAQGDALVQATSKERSKRPLSSGMFDVRAALAGERDQPKSTSSTSGSGDNGESVPFSQRIRKHRPAFQAPRAPSAPSNELESTPSLQQFIPRQIMQVQVETESPALNSSEVAPIAGVGVGGSQKPDDPYFYFNNGKDSRASPIASSGPAQLRRSSPSRRPSSRAANELTRPSSAAAAPRTLDEVMRLPIGRYGPRVRQSAMGGGIDRGSVRASVEPESKRRRISSNGQEKKQLSAKNFTDSTISEDEDDSGGKRFNFHG